MSEIDVQAIREEAKASLRSGHALAALTAIALCDRVEAQEREIERLKNELLTLRGEMAEGRAGFRVFMDTLISEGMRLVRQKEEAGG